MGSRSGAVSRKLRCVGASALLACAASTSIAQTTLPAPTSGRLQIWFQAPQTGDTVGGMLSLESCYVRGRSVSRVHFFLDSTALNSDTNVADGMSCVLDTRLFPNGTHQLRAVAYNSSGAMVQKSISINIQNAPPPPPPSEPPPPPPPSEPPPPPPPSEPPPPSTSACALPANPGIALAVVPSRTSGVAPLAVFFDASATVATATTRPFHDLGFFWDFGDTNAPTAWNNGSKPGANPRNRASGPVAAHVFETPGTYQVCVTATDMAGTMVDGAVTITVDDPNIVFSGTNTICYSASGNFAGCPTGARQVTTASFVTALADAAPGRRLLFRGGEVFTTPGTAVLSGSGPGIVGAFGSGKAIIRSTAASGATLLRVGSSAVANSADWRVMDLELDGESKRNNSVVSSATFDQLTLLRLHIHDIGTGPNFAANGLNAANTAYNTPHHLWDQLAIVDSTIQRIIGGQGATGLFLSATRMALMGNLIDDTTASEHPVRFQYAGRLVFSNNTVQGAPNSNSVAGSKETLTLRAPPSSNGSHCGNPGNYLPFYNVFPGGVAVTEKVVISDNRIVVRGFVGINIKHVDQCFDTRFKDIILERNWYHAAPGSVESNLALEIRGDEVTARNEIIDLSRFMNAHLGILVVNDPIPGTLPVPTWTEGIAPASNVRLYNNSVYSADAGNFIAIRLHSGVRNVTVQNNLGYGPAANSGNLFMIQDEGALPAPTMCASCNSTTAEALDVDPLWTMSSPMTPAGFRPGSSSYAIGRGIRAPVFSDFWLNPAVSDAMGAVHP